MSIVNGKDCSMLHICLYLQYQCQTNTKGRTHYYSNSYNELQLSLLPIKSNMFSVHIQHPGI